MAAPSEPQPAQPQAERAHGALSAPAATPQAERFQRLASELSRLTRSISWFGATPVLASGYGTRANAARSASIWPAPPAPLIGLSVAISSVLTWSGVRYGRACTSSAAAPATTGAAIEVPPALK